MHNQLLNYTINSISALLIAVQTTHCGVVCKDLEIRHPLGEVEPPKRAVQLYLAL